MNYKDSQIIDKILIFLRDKKKETFIDEILNQLQIEITEDKTDEIFNIL